MKFLTLLIILAPIAFFVVVAAQPSCKDQGGRLVPDGDRRNLILVGKVLVPVQAYRCEVRK